MEVGTRFAGILVLVLLPLTACALEQDPVIVTRPPFPGVYRLESAAGERLPAPVSTAWLEGHVTGGSLVVDREAGFRLSLTGRSVTGEAQSYEVRGSVTMLPDDAVAFFDLEGQELWRGQRVGSSVVIRNVQAIELEFLWVGPWTHPA